jgi:hypothetical protein
MDGEAQMKTLGQIAYEATAGAGRFEWLDLVKHDREVWEVSASAVAEVCAKVCEDRLEIDGIHSNFICAKFIRALKGKQ